MSNGAETGRARAEGRRRLYVSEIKRLGMMREDMTQTTLFELEWAWSGKCATVDSRVLIRFGHVARLDDERLVKRRVATEGTMRMARGKANCV